MMTLQIVKRFLAGSLLFSLCLSALALLGMDAPQPLSGKLIVVDAGHGGVDGGANRPGIQEKDINLGVALALRDALKQYNAKVVLTRDTDRELSELCDNEKVKGRYHRDLNARLEMVEESDADLFVSIHANASPHPRKQGIESYYAASSENSKQLALAIERQLAQLAPVSQKATSARFFVLRKNKVPAVLIEVGLLPIRRNAFACKRRSTRQSWLKPLPRASLIITAKPRLIPKEPAASAATLR